MKTSHTPEPWTVNDRSYPSDQVFSADGVIVADCKWTNHTPEQRIANAAHIVRAVNSHSDLLAALQAIAANTDHDCLYQGTAAMMRDMARAAIARATA